MRTALALSVLIFGASAASAADLRVCPSGCQFSTIQAALNAATPGDQVLIAPGNVYKESLILPTTRHGDNPVIVKSTQACPIRQQMGVDAPTKKLQAAEDAKLMPTLAPRLNYEATITGAGVQGWRFECLHLTNPGGLYNIVYIDSVKRADGTYLDSDNITFDRNVITSVGRAGVRTGLYINGSRLYLINNHIAGFQTSGAETKAVIIRSGPCMPCKVLNNFLEAEAIPILFGGGTSLTPAHVPADIEFAYNHTYKDPAWKTAGTTAKNMFELKNAIRVHVHHNLMENNWTGGQAGHSILFQPINDDGDSPWSRITDVLFEQNIIRNGEKAINLLGFNYMVGYPSQGMARVTFRDNLFLNHASGTGSVLLASGEIDSLTIENNTFDNGQWGSAVYLYADQIALPGGKTRPGLFSIKNFNFVNNLMRCGEYGLFGDAVAGPGLPTITKHLVTPHITNNVCAGISGQSWGTGTNWFPSLTEFASQFNPGMVLKEGSAYRTRGINGGPLGVRLSDVVVPPPPPTPPEPVPPTPVPPTPEPPTPTPPQPTPPPTTDAVVTAMTLVSSTAGTVLGPADNATIPSGMPVSLRAETVGSVASVVFDVNGEKRTENAPPWTVAGDNVISYNPWTPPVGTHTVTAIPYSDRDGTGQRGQGATAKVTVEAYVPPPAPTDATSPRLEIVSITRSGQSHNYRVTVRASDNVRVAKLQVSINDGAFTEYHNPAEQMVLPMVITGSGRHTIMVQAVDTSGNTTSLMDSVTR